MPQHLHTDNLYVEKLQNAWWTVLVIQRHIYNMFFKKAIALFFQSNTTIPYVISSISVVSIYYSKILWVRSVYCFCKV